MGRSTSLRARPGFCIAAIVAVVAGCAPDAPPRAARVTQTGPEVRGEWGDPFGIKTSGIHSSVLPTGEVLLFSYQFEGGKGSNARLWDPATGELTDVTMPRKRELFCSGHTLLADGRLFVAGGTKYGSSKEIGRLGTDLFDPFTRTWSNGPDLRYRRWYPTTTELPDGAVLIFSGQPNNRRVTKQVERFEPGTTTMNTLPRSANRGVDLYPRIHMLSDGRLLHTGPEDQSYFFEPSTSQWNKGPYQEFGYREAGTSVLLPGLDRVLVVGGAEGHKPTRTAEILELSDPDPQWRSTTRLNRARMHANSVLLPDGNVLVVGGGRHGEYSKTVRTPELFNPLTETWTELAPHTAPRAYHSTAVLLPDGRVLSAGHDNGGYWLKAEVYSPPYLFKGPPPVIQSAPPEVNYGEKFEVVVDDSTDVARLALMKPGSATHGVDFSQRYVAVDFSASDATTLEVSAPAVAEQAPPGYYMLFVVDADGVPSQASWIRLGGA
jgi:galactose oxidase